MHKMKQEEKNKTQIVGKNEFQVHKNGVSLYYISFALTGSSSELVGSMLTLASEEESRCIKEQEGVCVVTDGCNEHVSEIPLLLTRTVAACELRDHMTLIKADAK